MKGMDNRELIQTQKGKLNSNIKANLDQNEQIDTYINITKQGKNKAKEIKNEAQNQIKLLDNVEIDVS